MTLDVIAIAVVSAVTLGLGAYGWRFSRTTSDFFVASRSVRPGLNASAIGGEYLSAASFLGVAGLLLISGADMLWYPVGWTAGYLMLLVFVAAPLRRSGAYTLPDFAEYRLGSRTVRLLCSGLVVAIGWLYLLPQFQGAGIAVSEVTGAPLWVGGVLVAAVALLNVVLGGMRSITLVQAFQYWLKLTALLLPLAGIAVALQLDPPDDVSPPSEVSWGLDLVAAGPWGWYLTVSLILALVLGTMGLPHVVVRFYTNPDGPSARRTTVLVIGLLGVFYLLPPVYAVLARNFAPQLASEPDVVVLRLPAELVAGPAGEALSALALAGAFAAFLSTSSGLTIAVAGVISQDVARATGVRSFQWGAVVAVIVPLLAATWVQDLSVARAVGLAFAFTASTFCPLIVLGIWWRRLTDAGAVAGLVIGALGCGYAVLDSLLAEPRSGLLGALLGQPAAWTVPSAFLVMILVSLATPQRRPAQVGRMFVRLHTPESVSLRR